MKKTHYISVALLTTLAIVILWVWQTQFSTSHQTLNGLSSKPKGGNFTLQGSDGQVSLSDFKGKWVYLYFGYTYCPDICPTNLSSLASAYQQLTEFQKSQIQPIFISVDPERDTPKKLAEYVSYFNMDAIGLTGNPDKIAKIANQYGAVYLIHKTKQNPKHYSVDHSAFTYVISPDGELINQLPHGFSSKNFLTDMQQHLSK
jgi:protein SCO1/2